MIVALPYFIHYRQQAGMFTRAGADIFERQRTRFRRRLGGCGKDKKVEEKEREFEGRRWKKVT